MVHDNGDGQVEATALYNTSDVKGAGTALLKEAIDHHGANYVECFGPKLNQLYGKLGFKTMSTNPFNPEYAPRNWNTALDDSPNYHTMSITSSTSGSKRLTALLTYNKARRQMTENAKKSGTSKWPTIEELIADKDEIAAKQDPEWGKRYGEESWNAALALLGAGPTDIPMPK